MASEASPGGNAAPVVKECILRRVWLKDVSFESPHVPRILEGHEKPELEVGLTSSYSLSPEREGTFEVLVTATVTARGGSTTLFLVEVHQGGTFELRGYTSADEIKEVLRTRGPEALFPYVRELVASLVQRCGFPRLQLRPVDFEGLYAARLEQAAPA
jgi:preprotein translocase subunit SecB